VRQGLQAANEYLGWSEGSAAGQARKSTRNRARKAVSDERTVKIYIGTYVGTSTGVVGGKIEGPINQRTSAAADNAETSKPDEGSGRLWSFNRFILSQERVPDLGYILVLAALSGAPLSSVNRAADDLAERLLASQRLSESNNQGLPPIYIATPRRNLLVEVDCEIFTSTLGDSKAGERLVERVRFCEQGADQALLRDAWLNLRVSIPWMKSFLEWLSDQGRSADLELRLAAGRTAGFLATWDPAGAETILFDAWISGRALDALGAGLIALARTSEAAAQYVERCLIEWTEGQKGKDRIIAAALLATGAFGQAMPDVAFRLLASLVRQRRHLTLDLAAMGYVVWFAAAADDPRLGGRVIREISDLPSAHDDNIIRQLASAYFLLLTTVLDDDDDEEDDDLSESLFLDVLEASPEALKLAARMFNDVLAPNIYAKAALERFRLICFCGFRNGARRQQAFLTLADAMHEKGDEGERDTLHYWLDHWLNSIEEQSVGAGLALSSWLKKSSMGEIMI